MKTLPVNVSPRCGSSKRLRYGRQIGTLYSICLLLFEVLHGGKILENSHYKEGVRRKRDVNNAYRVRRLVKVKG
jgi:hypothetical protein